MKIIYLSILSFALYACENSNIDESNSLEKVKNTSQLIVEINESSSFDFDSTKVINYDVEYGNDISYAGNSRATVRVMLNVSDIPTEEEITMTSYKIFKENTQGWNEVTIWTYLPEMDIKSAAYGIFEINNKGEVSFFINEASLIATKWYK